MERDIRHGFSNVKYALATITGSTITYGEVKDIKGAVSWAPSRSGSKQEVFADNMPWYEQTPNTGVSGDASFMVLPDEFLKDALGYIADDNGALLEVANASQMPFALMGEVEGKAETIRFVYFYCNASPPTDAYETDTAQYVIKNQTVTISATPMDLGVIGSKGNKLMLSYARLKRSEGAVAYDKWFDAVYIPEITTPPAPTPEPPEA